MLRWIKSFYESLNIKHALKEGVEDGVKNLVSFFIGKAVVIVFVVAIGWFAVSYAIDRAGEAIASPFTATAEWVSSIDLNPFNDDSSAESAVLSSEDDESSIFDVFSENDEVDSIEEESTNPPYTEPEEGEEDGWFKSSFPWGEDESLVANNLTESDTTTDPNATAELADMSAEDSGCGITWRVTCYFNDEERADED